MNKHIKTDLQMNSRRCVFFGLMFEKTKHKKEFALRNEKGHRWGDGVSYELHFLRPKMLGLADPKRKEMFSNSRLNVLYLLLTLLGAPGLTTSNKKLLGAPGIATRSKDVTRGSRQKFNMQVQVQLAPTKRRSYVRD